MKFLKNVALSALVACLSVNSASAQLHNDEVIYKIHDVEPIEEGGKIVGCSYGFTAFNRAPQMLSNLSLKLSWNDEVIADQITAEKNEKVYDNNGNVSGYKGQSQTEKYTTKKITSSISLPPLAVDKQISVKAELKTDRCFLLLSKPQLTVETCKYGSASSEKTAGICQNLFVYVSPQQGDYYTDFGPVSYEIEQSEAEKLNEAEKRELDNLYKGALSSINRLSQTLTTIQ